MATQLDITKIPVEEFTQAKVDGDGVFDVLMQAVKAHLREEFDANRIKGTEYADVYLGSIQHTMQTALQFFIAGRKTLLEERLLEKQIELADKEIEAADKRLAMMDCEQALCQANVLKVNAETVLITAQADKIPHEIELAKQQALLAEQQVELAKSELLLNEEKLLIAKEELLLAKEQLKKQPHEIKILEEQAKKIEQEVLNLKCEQLLCQANIRQVDKAITMLEAQLLNVPKEGEVLDAQVCKLKADFDLAMATVDKAGAEKGLLVQKTATERAQVSGAGTDADSVIGKQKELYSAQIKGFKDDAIATMAKELISTWNVRRTTDEGTPHTPVNKLDDPTIGNVLTQWGNTLGINI